MDNGNQAAPDWGRHMPGELLDRWPRDESGALEAPVYLCHCRGLDMDDAVLVGRMESYGIPCLRQYPNDGEFGRLILGVSAPAWTYLCPPVCGRTPANFSKSLKRKWRKSNELARNL